jgi:hypothetical protein
MTSFLDILHDSTLWQHGRGSYYYIQEDNIIPLK